MVKQRIRVVSAAIIRNGRYLITQRQQKAVLPLLWEFPGGKVEPGESDYVALKRELKERLGLEASVEEHLSSTEREYDGFIVELHLYRCHIGNAEPQVINIREFRWVGSNEFSAYEFTPADQKSMHALLFSKVK
ncbi:MAG: (deoxy)nucleoside triphosphate pyrophosphohydrolase [Deltaproteobacteria bacterium]|nr:(deoxy)nucleoside triphosphate pyrophosphohydrolase [Deltaproteobacteria bacterium]